MQDQYKTRCEYATDFFQHSQRLVKLFDVLSMERAAVSEFDQMQYLMMTTEHLPDVSVAVQDYTKMTPVLRNQSFDEMVIYVKLRLVNTLKTGRNYGSASATAYHLPSGAEATNINLVNAAFTPATTMESLMTMIATLSAKVDSNAKKQKQQQGNGTGTTGNQQNQSNTPNPLPKKYCFHHGYQRTHTGFECTFMRNNVNATTKQRTADGPGLIDGVKGRT
jgi:hypothetical protein